MTVTVRGYFKRQENTFLLGRTMSSTRGHPLCVGEKVTEGKNMCRFLTVTDGLTCHVPKRKIVGTANISVLDFTKDSISKIT